MSILLWVLAIYMMVGIVAAFVCLISEPILFHAGVHLVWMIPVMALLFPYCLWVIVLFPDKTGRWV